MPAVALTAHQAVLAQPHILVPPSVPTAMVTAAFVALGSLDEGMLRSPNASELIISLQGATWAHAAEWINGTHARSVLEGLRCGAAEHSGWDAVVAPRLVNTARAGPHCTPVVIVVHPSACPVELGGPQRADALFGALRWGWSLF